MPNRTRYQRRTYRRRRTTRTRSRTVRTTFRKTRRFSIRRKLSRPYRLSIRRFPSSPWPSILRTKLEYVTYFGGTPGDSLAYFQLRGNSLYDPDITRTSGTVQHQPRGFDQLLTMYERWTVGGSKLSVIPIITPDVTNTGTAAIVCIRAWPAAANGTIGTPAEATIDLAMEAPGARWRIYHHGQPQRGMKCFARTNEVYGQSREDIRVAKWDFGALENANPTRSWAWTVHCQNPDLATDTAVQFWVKIVYYCTFFVRKNPVRSEV